MYNVVFRGKKSQLSPPGNQSKSPKNIAQITLDVLFLYNIFYQEHSIWGCNSELVPHLQQPCWGKKKISFLITRLCFQWHCHFPSMHNLKSLFISSLLPAPKPKEIFNSLGLLKLKDLSYSVPWQSCIIIFVCFFFLFSFSSPHSTVCFLKLRFKLH